jgi:hypothetical protein
MFDTPRWTHLRSVASFSASAARLGLTYRRRFEASCSRCQSSGAVTPPKCIEMLVIQVTTTWKGNDHGENHDQTNGWGLKKSPISFSNKPKWGFFKFQGLVLLVFVCYIFLRFIFGFAQTQRVSRLTNRNSSPSMPWIRCYFLGEDLWDQQR